MNEIKAKLKKLAALCIDKEVVFVCNGTDGAFIYYAYDFIDGEIKYISNPLETAADWRADSIDRIDEVIALVEAYNG